MIGTYAVGGSGGTGGPPPGPDAGDIAVINGSVSIYTGAGWSSIDSSRTEDIISVKTSEGKYQRYTHSEAKKILAEHNHIEELAKEFPQVMHALRTLQTIVKLHTDTPRNENP